MNAPIRYARDLGGPHGYSAALHELLARLPDLSDGLAAALDTLRRDPTPDGCDLMVVRLAGIQSHVRRICAELLRDEPPIV